MFVGIRMNTKACDEAESFEYIPDSFIGSTMWNIADKHLMAVIFEKSISAARAWILMNSKD